MAFWAVILKIVKVILEAAKILVKIKKYAGMLSALSQEGLQGFIRSYFVSNIVDGLAKEGIPLDKLYYLEGALVDQAEKYIEDSIIAISEILRDYKLRLCRKITFPICSMLTPHRMARTIHSQAKSLG